MEKEEFLGANANPDWRLSNTLSSGMISAPPSDQIQYCFLNPSWDQCREQSAAQFESAMSSIVSSPSNLSHLPTGSVAIELIGRLGTICNSGEVSSHGYSCYTTPLNSPPKLGLSMAADGHQQAFGNLPVSGNPVSPSETTPHLGPFAADPGFAERAARFSSYGGRNFVGLPGHLGVPDSGRLSRVSSSKSFLTGATPIGSLDNSEVPMPEDSLSGMRLRASSPLADGQLETTVAVHAMAGGNSKKRKSLSKSKDKGVPSSPKSQDLLKAEECEFNSDAKKSRTFQANVEQNNHDVSCENGHKQEKDSNNKALEAPKLDYIHVRARRGQATDSHSLAERVRREKISERMKFLQDLVPGCNKVTGKAVMLDEIINYVQSLQRQVEFLSMKLATVNPHLDFDMEPILQKDMLQPSGALPHPVYPMAPALPFAQQPLQGSSCQSTDHCLVNSLDVSLRRCLSEQLSKLDGFEDAASVVNIRFISNYHSNRTIVVTYILNFRLRVFGRMTCKVLFRWALARIRRACSLLKLFMVHCPQGR